MSKTMIFLMDGTTNDASSQSFSNVYAINQLIAETKQPRDEPLRTQVTFYLPGVGTKFTVKRAVNRKSWFSIRTDTVRQQIFGDNLEQLILRAYINLCANYRRGDEIVLIGFSRGAAAARIFSRLISDLGILTSDMLMFLDRLWNEFIEISKAADDRDYYGGLAELKLELQRQANKVVFHKFGEDGSPDCDVPTIKFMGLFDTVIGSLDDELCKNLNFRDQRPARSVEHVVHLLSMHDVRGEYELIRFDVPISKPKSFREIWMPGVHSDVGGGYSEDFIALVSLLTMADFLKELADVALIKSSHDQVRGEIKKRVFDKRFVINKEPFVSSRKSRIASVQRNDEIHPLHHYLTGKDVRWKTDAPGVAALTKYEDTLDKVPTILDPRLQNLFGKWVD